MKIVLNFQVVYKNPNCLPQSMTVTTEGHGRAAPWEVVVHTRQEPT